ncbi:Nance-Horan syndrome protein [Takifugu flavidus]|uniref:Nance-Horan syndrome protein n=1 Tax=Takifugu flavidus TaxID=433684 RepID=A0A5C6MRK3_9TELE|nr:Nance-Horan syndrome protein [Takifugu flavidus]
MPGLARKRRSLQHEVIGAAESNLDVESKRTVHYQTPWHRQRNIFQPSTRPACVEELYGQANFSLWALDQDHQRRRSGCRERRVTISALPPMPLYPPAHISQRGINLATFESTRSSSPTECCRFSPWSRKVVVPPRPPSCLPQLPPSCYATAHLFFSV